MSISKPIQNAFIFENVVANIVIVYFLDTRLIHHLCNTARKSWVPFEKFPLPFIFYGISDVTLKVLEIFSILKIGKVYS